MIVPTLRREFHLHAVQITHIQGKVQSEEKIGHDVRKAFNTKITESNLLAFDQLLFLRSLLISKVDIMCRLGCKDCHLA